MPAKCPKCHSKNPEESKFCSECATPLPGMKEAVHTKTMETTAQELTRGSTFAGRYEIIEELGKGGMGRVYRVSDKKLDEEAALKLIKPEIASDKKTVERFKREIKLARKISHKNVGRVHELMDEKGIHFITMEYVSGQDLKGLIKQSAPLSVARTIMVAKQICEGLIEAHRMGIVHRDLKPSNIMIDREGDIKIMDFGIARSLKGKGITGAGVMIGTPEYMSPEQVEAKDTDQRSDIYSLGIILYEMATGKLPFEADTPFAVGIKQKSEAPKDPKEFNPQISDDLNQVILKCLEKEKENRYQSVNEVRSELENIEKGIPTTEKEKIKRKPVTSKEITVTFGRRWMMIAALAAVVILAGLAVLYFIQKKPPPLPEKKMIAVLPFENLGSPEDEYFGDGMAQEIMVRLSSISDIGIIAQSSANQYKNTSKSIQEIAEELGVDYILRGTTRWQKSQEGLSRIRVTPQLISVTDATQLWANVYERDMSDVFQVQSEIAEKVIQQLNITLQEEDLFYLKAIPTNNMDAYQAYLRGLKYAVQEQYSIEMRQLEIQMFERAVKLDPSFAEAHASLSFAHSQMINLGMDRSEERLIKSKSSLDRALELQPDLPEAQIALGYYYYWGLRDYDKALEVFFAAEARSPNKSFIYRSIAWILRRKGQWQKSLDYSLKALKLSPRDGYLLGQIGVTLVNMRRYQESLSYLDRAISLAPDDRPAYLYKSFVYLYGYGDLERSRAVLESMPQRADDVSAYFWFVQNAMERNFQEALDILASWQKDIRESPSGIDVRAEKEGLMYRFLGENEKSINSYESALMILNNEVKKRPEDGRLHIALGLFHAGLGNKEDAIREGKRGVELLPVEKDALHGPTQVMLLAHIYILVGEQDAALEQLEYLLSIPNPVSTDFLKIDPMMDPLRDYPRFKQLLKRGESR